MNDVKIFTNVIEETAKEQIELLSQQKSFCDQKIRIMPDVHAGKGCVIGFTSTMGDYVVPNVVGVDIGCGMYTLRLGTINVNLPVLDDYLPLLDSYIRANIPSGRYAYDDIMFKFDQLEQLRCFGALKNVDHIRRSLGTLGGGNHFIEIGKDSKNDVYLTIHSGSRNLGKQVAEYYQNLANERCNLGDHKAKSEAIIAELKAQNKENKIADTLKELRKQRTEAVPKDLAYLTGADMEDYLHDMAICQEYATYNRIGIAATITSHMCQQGLITLTTAINCDRFETIHNYVDIERRIIRKGAVSAQDGELLLIPLNMRDGSILARGKGNPDWNYSAPHGAGRIMGRIQAKKTLTMEIYESSMRGIYTTSVSEDTLDEAPMAYKKMSDIVGAIGDTVEILSIIAPIYNFKASE